MDVKGMGLEVDVTPKRMRLLGDVHTVLRHDAARRSPELVVALLLATDDVRARRRRRRPRAARLRRTRSPTPKRAATRDQTFFGFGGTKSKEPITITSDTLEYEYKDGVIVYRGDVLAMQGEVKIKSNELRITLAKSDDDKKKGGADATRRARRRERVEAAVRRRDRQRAHRSGHEVGRRRQGDVRPVEPHARAHRESRDARRTERGRGDRVVVYPRREPERRRRAAASA
jgi:hypothetical protein